MLIEEDELPSATGTRSWSDQENVPFKAEVKEKEHNDLKMQLSQLGFHHIRKDAQERRSDNYGERQ